jgi:hypothetical protein
MTENLQGPIYFVALDKDDPYIESIHRMHHWSQVDYETHSISTLKRYTDENCNTGQRR